MSGLAHLLEREGFATVTIALYTPHAKKIRPPRALAVPFLLGRPLGVPNDAKFQRRVLLAALKLLDRPKGPVFTVFPDEAPGADATGWVPAVALEAPYDGHTGAEKFAPALEREMAKLEPYYQQAVKTRGRTTVGASGYSLKGARDFVLAFLSGKETPKPGRGLNKAMALKLACEDLAAYYTEAAAITGKRPSPADMTAWLYNDTTLGQALLRAVAICEKSEDPNLKEIATGLLLPDFWDFRKKPKARRRTRD